VRVGPDEERWWQSHLYRARLPYPFHACALHVAQQRSSPTVQTHRRAQDEKAAKSRRLACRS
jgi:hypothetical protein